MSIYKSYAVFGLGRYGTAVAKELVQNGAEVLAVDIDENTVNSAADFLPVCKCADVTDEDVIRQLGISNIDVVIIAMAGNLEAGVMATTLCKEAGVERVVVKCSDEIHCKILKRVGADEVVFPEKESGIRLAKNLLSSGFVDIIELSGDVSVLEIGMKPEWVGKTLVELNLRKNYSVNVVAIRCGEDVCCDIDPQKALDKNSSLIVVTNPERLARLK